MILVIASELDEVAEQAAHEWPRGDALLLRPRDLCSQGWRVEVGRVHEGVLIAGGKALPASSVTGVLNRLAFIDERELVAIELADRRYVASELTAFLFFVLSQLECRMYNRPRVNNLLGCDWRMQEWIHYARACGISFDSLKRTRHTSAAETGAQLKRTIVLDGTILESNDEHYQQNVVELARRAGVSFADLCYSVDEDTCTLHSVSLMPDLAHRATTAALHESLGEH